MIPTNSLAAYNLYTQGRDNLYKRRLETLLRAREQFEAAIALDPDYADAYVGLADSVLLIRFNHAAISSEEAFDVAEPALEKALTLNPELADAYASLGLLQHQQWLQTRSGPGLEEAAASFVSALDLNPNSATAYMWFSGLRATQRRIDEAIELLHESLRLDPLGKIPYANLPSLYASRGQNDQALELYLKAVEIHPEWPTAYQNLAYQMNFLGRFDEAVAWGKKGHELSTDPIGGAAMALAYIEFGEFDKVMDIFSDITPGHPIYLYGLVCQKLFQNDFTGAVELIETAIEGVENPQQIQLTLIASFSMLAGDFDKARKYSELVNPEFVADADPEADAFNVPNMIAYAFILQNLGENKRADTLLDIAMSAVRTQHRMGLAGHGIRDVQILALQGRSFDALAALREAIDEGFRGSVVTSGWPVVSDPYLDSLRSQPAFQAMIGELDDALAEMQQRVTDAEQSGNWDELRALITAADR
jgi:tetratricopeptide (TPR) repeat protein